MAIFSNHPRVGGMPLPVNEWGIDVLISQFPVPLPSQSDGGASAIRGHLGKDGKACVIVLADDMPIFAEEDGWLDRIVALSSLSCLPEQKLLFIELNEKDFLQGKKPLRKIHQELAILWRGGGGIPVICDYGCVEDFVRAEEKALPQFSKSFRKRWQMLADEVGGVVIEK